MSVKDANQGEQKQPEINTEIDFNSSDIVEQNSGELFVNVDGVKSQSEPEETEPSAPEEDSSLINIQSTPAPRRSILQKIPLKLIIIIIAVLAGIGLLTGAGILIYRFIHRDEISSEENLEAEFSYDEKLNEIIAEYESSYDYDAALVKLDALIDEAKTEQNKIRAQNKKLLFLAKFAAEYSEAEEFRATYCQDGKYQELELCEAPDRILYVNRRDATEENE